MAISASFLEESADCHFGLGNGLLIYIPGLLPLGLTLWPSFRALPFAFLEFSIVNAYRSRYSLASTVGLELKIDFVA